MSRSITVHLLFQNNGHGTDVHRFRNFGEDVFRFLRESGWGELALAEVDMARSHFAVHGVKAAKVRRLETWLKQEAKRHFLPIATEVHPIPS